MRLSVSSFPSSANGVAGVVLMVSVTDANGVHYTGLQKANFSIAWIDNATIAETIKSMTVAEYKPANQLPDLPGVYMVEIQSERASWLTVSTFFIAVHEDDNHGQILYRVDPTALRPWLGH